MDSNMSTFMAVYCRREVAERRRNMPCRGTRDGDVIGALTLGDSVTPTPYILLQYKVMVNERLFQGI